VLTYDWTYIRKSFESLWRHSLYGKWCALKFMFLAHRMYLRYSAVYAWRSLNKWHGR